MSFIYLKSFNDKDLLNETYKISVKAIGDDKINWESDLFSCLQSRGCSDAAPDNVKQFINRLSLD